ncbi:hypothetical protein D9611_011743 [Ephemerocybe angulata]|uniref:DNA 3'-5' helicase n=1 Tax=Ephemerocybe angulata TaxID=980116 RepID=A0A8H5C515_9AGAR|nr:hypothetical protein D9611_011743 [Tulosesus angulatus]
MQVDTPEDTSMDVSLPIDVSKLTKMEDIEAAYRTRIPADRRLPDGYWTKHNSRLLALGMKLCLALHTATDGRISPKEFQLDSALALLSGKDSEVDAGTGSGKTICMILPALLSGGLSIIVSPLKTVQEGQVKELARFGVRAFAVNEDTSKDPKVWQDVWALKYTVLIVQPEQLSMHQGHFSRLARIINNKKFSKHIRLVHVDEAHFIHLAGIKRHGRPAFRPAWGNLGPFRLKLSKHVRFQSLSGTQPPHIKKTIREHLLFEETRLHCIKITSNRPNICSATHSIVGSLDDFSNLVYTLPMTSVWPPDFCLEDLKKGVIFHESIERCTAAANFLDKRLPTDLQGKGIIRPFHAGMSKPYLVSVLEDFRDPKGTCRQLHATEIAAVGIDVKDVAYVVQYGVTNEVPVMLQRAGRAGRDGVSECIFLLQTEKFVEKINLRPFGENIWSSDDPDQPHSGDLNDRSKKEQRVGIGMAKILQSDKCLRETFAEANGDTTDDGNGFRFGSFFPGEMLYEDPKTKKRYFGDVDNPRKNEIVTKPTVAPESLKRARPKYRPTGYRPALVHALEKWRFDAWKASPIRGAILASSILPKECIQRLSMLTLEDHLTSEDELAEALDLPASWKAKYAKPILGVIRKFEDDVKQLKQDAKVEEEERLKRRKIEEAKQSFEKASEEMERAARENALAQLCPAPTAGPRRSARLAKPADSGNNAAASSSSIAAEPPSEVAAAKAQELLQQVRDGVLSFDEVRKMLGARRHITDATPY